MASIWRVKRVSSLPVIVANMTGALCRSLHVLVVYFQTMWMLRLMLKPSTKMSFYVYTVQWHVSRVECYALGVKSLCSKTAIQLFLRMLQRNALCRATWRGTLCLSEVWQVLSSVCPFWRSFLTRGLKAPNLSGLSDLASSCCCPPSVGPCFPALPLCSVVPPLHLALPFPRTERSVGAGGDASVVRASMILRTSSLTST